MIRLILLAALLYVIWRVLRFWWQQLSRPNAPGQQPVPMLRCDQCHTYFPAHDAQRHGNRVFCSTEHLEDWRHRQ